MPEIAEVRLIADNISHFLKGNRIIQIEILHPELIPKYINKNIKGVDAFNLQLKEKIITVQEVKTRGKFCWLVLDDGWYAMVGFGMSGNIRPEPTDEYLKTFNDNNKSNSSKTKKLVTRDEFLKHCHLKIHYLHAQENTNKHIFYHDIRRFGSWNFTNDVSVLNKKLNKLGNDPLFDSYNGNNGSNNGNNNGNNGSNNGGSNGSNNSKTDAEIIAIFRKYNHQNICKALMSQEMIAGVGAYIRAEVLYEAKIHPLAQISNIPDSTLVVLYNAIKTIANDAYKDGGASLYTYTGMNGDKSNFKETLKVYGQDKDPLGNTVAHISDKNSPDKRSIFWVPAVQTIGFSVVDSLQTNTITSSPITSSPITSSPIPSSPTPKKKIIIKMLTK